MKKILTIILVLFLSSSAFAQEPKLSETEQLKIQILNLQYALKAEQEKSSQLTTVYGQCQSALLKDNSGLQKMAEELEQEISKNHEGYSFDISTGTFKKSEPPVEKK